MGKLRSVSMRACYIGSGGHPDDGNPQICRIAANIRLTSYHPTSQAALFYGLVLVTALTTAFSFSTNEFTFTVLQNTVKPKNEITGPARPFFYFEVCVSSCAS